MHDAMQQHGHADPLDQQHGHADPLDQQHGHADTLDLEAFRRNGYAMVDWVAGYLRRPRRPTGARAGGAGRCARPAPGRRP